MNLAPAPDKYLREVVQEILNEVLREDLRNLKRDVNETHNGSLNVNGLINAVGGGVNFPTAQVPSSDPNVLDDYEEGTFTPTIGDGTNNYTLNVAVGTYTKVGNLVHVDVAVRWTSIGSAGAGQLRVNGLPFSSSSMTFYQAGASIAYFDDFDTAATLNQIMGYIGTSSTSIAFYRAADNAGASALPANSSGATGEVELSATYRV